jgi:hypothetical protein
MRSYKAICGRQDVYFLVTGVWPLVCIESFQLVTGRKTHHRVTGHEADHWLDNTVGVLVIVIGLALLFAAWRGRFSFDSMILGAGSAIGLLDRCHLLLPRHNFCCLSQDAALKLHFA